MAYLEFIYAFFKFLMKYSFWPSSSISSSFIYLSQINFLFKLWRLGLFKTWKCLKICARRFAKNHYKNWGGGLFIIDFFGFQYFLKYWKSIGRNLKFKFKFELANRFSEFQKILKSLKIIIKIFTCWISSDFPRLTFWPIFWLTFDQKYDVIFYLIYRFWLIVKS